MPVLFVGHGNPMNAIERNAFHLGWAGMAARLPVPTPEHYLPLLYAVALQQPHEEAEFFNVSVPDSISMTSVLIGGSATGA
jgi:4,5-DOPA dioxygenase extradiol